MPELPDVIAGEAVESAWGNDIRDRTLQRYLSSNERDSLVPLPVAGDMAYLEDIAATQVFDGVSWSTLAIGGPYLPLAGGIMAGAINLDDHKLQNIEAVEIVGTFVHQVLGDDLVVRIGSTNVVTFAEALITVARMLQVNANMSVSQDLDTGRNRNTQGTSFADQWQRNVFITNEAGAVAPITGDVLIDSDTKQIKAWNGSAWQLILSGT